MTDTARRLGMTASEFRNANGLPDQGQVTTARDLAVLTMALIRDFPQYYGYFHTDQLSYGKQHFNHGVKFVELYAPYADGLKTGFICASGFNLVGSAVRDGRRLIAVALGFRRADLRDEFMVRLMDEAFALKTGGRTMVGNPYSVSVRTDEILDKLARHPIWTDRAQEKARAAAGTLVGTGVACVTKDYGAGADACLGRVELSADGRIAIHCDHRRWDQSQRHRDGRVLTSAQITAVTSASAT